MIEFLKKQPFVGLALAIAAGYVLAHFAVKTADYFYDNVLDSSPVSALFLVAFMVFVALLTYRYGSRFLLFLKTHRRPLFAVTGALVLVYIIMVVERMDKDRRLEIAREVYTDEYNRRCAQFMSDHVGATAEEFHQYELHPKALYGYADILKRMKDNHELFGPRRLGFTLSSDKDEPADEKTIEQLAKVTQVDLQTVRLNFDAIRRRSQKAQGVDSFTSCGMYDTSFAPYTYEAAYATRLRDVTNPPPALRRDLYDQIVLGKQQHQ